MRRTVLSVIVALLAGFALGVFCGSGVSSGPAFPIRATAATSIPMEPIGMALSTPQPLDRADNTVLLGRAGQALTAMKNADYAALSALVHPVKGVTLTPYSTVTPACDRNLTALQVSRLAEDREVYVWGVLDGKGDPIQLTGAEYFQRFVFNTDYTRAPQIAADTVLGSGNALENAADAYPEARFVEYHFPGLDPKMEGFDWCSLKLVFEEHQSGWYLVGLIHSEWTI